MQTPDALSSEPGASMAPGSQAEAASGPAVEISHLRKTYGALVAVTRRKQLCNELQAGEPVVGTVGTDYQLHFRVRYALS